MKMKEIIGVKLRMREEMEGGIYNEVPFLFKIKYKDVERNLPTSYR
ncbi:hypothetical protein SM62_04596 [Klebsiella variicola]|nr:hypothetical protein SM62_04596 [Klebsiella variicola]